MQEHPASVAQNAEWVRQAASDRLDELELALHIWRVVVTDDRRTAAEAVIAQQGVALTVDEILESPYYLIGTVDYMVDRLRELRHLYGISYILVFPRDTEAFAPVIARFASIPAAAAQIALLCKPANSGKGVADPANSRRDGRKRIG